MVLRVLVAIPGIIDVGAGGGDIAQGNIAQRTAGGTSEITFKSGVASHFAKVFSLGCGPYCDDLLWDGMEVSIVLLHNTV